MERRLKSLRRKFLSVFLSLCLSFGFVPSMSAVVSAAPGTQVYVEPNLVGAKAINDTFFVDIKVADVTDLYGFQFNVSFSPSVLEVQTVKYGEDVVDGGIAQGPLGPADNTHVAFGFGMTWDNTAGIISNVNATRLFTGGEGYDKGVDIGATGASLARITFKVKALGLSNINLSGDLLSDSLIQPIAHSTTGGGFDNVLPTVDSTSPTSSATNVPVADNITATFSEDMDATTIDTSNFTLLQGLTPVAGIVGYDAATKTATFNPDSNLSYSTSYTATVTLGVKDLAGNALASDYVWSFATEAPPADATAPAAVIDLATSEPTNNSIKLSWTAPGDDGAVGTASQYDIRYSTSIIDTDVKFDAATAVTSEPTPQVAGSAETFVVTGLTPSTTYYFALKTSDEVSNVSGLSNSPNGITLAPPADTTAPAAVTNLATSDPTRNSIKLTWTAPGNDGTTGTAYQYDIRYASSIVDTDVKFDSATQASGEPTPQVADSAESFVVTGLNLSTTYYFVLKTRDEVPNWSALSNSPAGTTAADNPPSVSISIPADGSTIGGTVNVTATASDDVGIDKVEFYVDNVKKDEDDSSPYEYSWDTTLETDGSHAVKAKAYDTIGQTAEDTNNVTVDNIKPTSTITKPADGEHLYQSTYTITGTASNGTSGVNKVEVSTDGGTTWNLAAGTTSWSYSWTVPTEGIHSIKSRATDNTGNVQDPPTSITVTVERHYEDSISTSGGTVETAYGDELEIPEGALSETTLVSIDVRSISSPGIPAPPAGVTALPKVLDFSPDGLTFAKDVTITIHYTDEEIAGLDENKLGVYYHDGSNWVFVEDPVRNSSANTLTIEVNHFTYFAIFVVPAPAVTSITPSSGVNTGSVNITNLAGTNFLSGATVKLKMSGQTDITGTSVVVVSSTKITCTFDITGKAAGKWDVVVTNPDGQSGTLAQGFTITSTTDTTPPAIPTGLTATAGNQEIALQWTANTETDLQGYKIYYGTASGSYGTPTTVGKVTSHRLTGITNDTKYYIALTAYDTSNNESAKSTEVSATPTALAVSGYYSLTVTLSVDKATSPPGNVLNYTITYKNTGIGTLTNAVLTNTIPQGTTYVADSATGGGVYNETAKTLTWTLLSLSPSSSGTVTFKVTMDAGATETIIDTVTAKSDQTPDPKTASVSTTISVVAGETGQAPAAASAEGAAALPGKLPKTGFNLLWYLVASLMAITLGFGLQYIDRFPLRTKTRIRRRKTE